MTENIILDGCNCVCDTATILIPKTKPTGTMQVLEIVLIVAVIVLVVAGLIIGFRKLNKEDEDNKGGTYY